MRSQRVRLSLVSTFTIRRPGRILHRHGASSIPAAAGGRLVLHGERVPLLFAAGSSA